MTKRILALALAFCMVFSLLPMGAQAKSLQTDEWRLEKNTIEAGKLLSDTWADLGGDVPTLADIGDHEVEEKEPNDNFSQANAIAHDDTVYGSITGDNADCFSFKVTELSEVTVLCISSTDGMVFGLADVGAQKVLFESEYLGYDEENGTHADGLACIIPAGNYGLIFTDYFKEGLEYAFYLEIVPHTHTYTQVVTAPTCTEKGFTTHTCDVCGHSYTDDEVEALGHSWDEGTVTKEPTETETGVRTHTCTDCGETKTEEIPVLEHVHSYVSMVTVPSCTEAGYTTYTCACGDSYKADEVPALGHSEVIDAAQVDPTCTETGLSAASHCERCGIVMSTQQELPALGHKEVMDSVQIDPTCTEPGHTAASHCERCGVSIKIRQELDALGHSEVTDAQIPATCTEPGKTAGKHCDRCGVITVAQEVVPALGHNETADEELLPTCTETGLTGGTHCDRCGIVIKEAEVVAALGHEEVVDEAVAPGCVDFGLTAGSHCGRCGIVIVAQEAVPSEGHDYKDGVCENCGQAAPEGAWKCGNELYAIFDAETGTLTISGTGYMYDYSGETAVPWDEYDGSVKKVVLEPGVSSIGAYAFAGCVNLETVAIPNNLEAIGDEAFAGCAKLTGVALPETVNSLGSGAFSGCESLRTVTVPAAVDTISDSAFAGCTGLEEVILQEGLIRIESSAFKNCSALEEITFPAGVKYIYDEAFAGCTGLKEITFLGDAPNTISEDAFTGVKANAWYYCRNTTWTEKKLQNYGGKLTWDSYNKEEDAEGKCGANLIWTYEAATDTLTVRGTGAMYDYGDAAETPWNQMQLAVVKIVVEDGAATIGKWAFAQLPELQEVQLPASVTYISDCAFAMCQNLTTINIPTRVTYIGEMCFQQCASLDNVVLPATLTSLEMYVFADCVSLTSITIPGSLTSIEEYALAGCTGLKEVIIEEGVPEIGDGMFVSCAALETITIPAGVKEIGAEAFFESGLNEIHFLGNAPAFGEGCFAECVANAYYPANNKTWTDKVMKDYGGRITWIVVGEVLPFDRISGKNRCETAFAAADALKEVLGVSKFNAIIITNGENFADALAGSYLANRKSAPILLFTKGYEDENLDYITKNLASGGTVYILGGTAAVPQSMEDALNGFTVKRLSGKTRFDTNLKILEEAGVTGQEILISTGWNFADCLSASATGLPILMVDSKGGKLTDSQIAFLKEHANNTYTVIGGTGAVSAELETMIEETIERQIGRLSGKNREATSVLVAKTYFSNPDYVLLAYSRNFPDGLCGGPLAYAMNAPLLLIDKGTEGDAADYVREHDITAGCVLGGTAAVSNESGKVVFGMK